MVENDINPFILLFAVSSIFLEMLKFILAQTKNYIESSQKTNQKIISLQNEIDNLSDKNLVLIRKQQRLEKYIGHQKKKIDEAQYYAKEYKKRYTNCMNNKQGDT